MRVFALLATAVLLAGCVHDTDDFTLLVADRGTSLIYYIGSPPGGKSEHDDPWDTIAAIYGSETVHTGKSGEPDDPWDTIMETYGEGSVRTSKPKHGGAQRDLRPEMRSSAVFLTFTLAEPAARLAFVEEVRGRVVKLCYADGSIQFVVDAPGSWLVGSWLEVDFYLAGSKGELPLLGGCTWRSW